MSGPRKRQALADKLRDLLAGQVLADLKSLAGFSRDNSIYEVRPLLVAVPADHEDLRRIIGFAAREGLTVTPRGGGSGTAGSGLGRGIVVSLPRTGPLSEIAGFAGTDAGPLVRAGAGVFHNDLQQYLRRRGYFLPADVSSAKISRLGGNVATKASGPHALKYGAIDGLLVRLEFFTARGELVDTENEATIPARIRDGLAALARKIGEDQSVSQLLAARAGLKTASGYNMSAFLKGHPAGELLARLLAGSVGTLGLITGATLRAAVYEPERATMLLFFAELAEAGRAAAAIRDAEVAAIELVSRETLRLVRKRSGRGRGLAPDGHLLLIELAGSGLRGKIAGVKKILRTHRLRTEQAPALIATAAETEELWELRRMLLPLIGSPAPHLKALAVVNDVGVEPSRLAPCIVDLEKVFEKHRLEAAIYGHAGSGNLHLRPLFDLKKPDLKGRIQALADDVYEVVFRYGGTITAEHGMGRLRAPYLRREWGDRLYGYMQELKNLFDPQGTLNPGVMLSDRAITEDLSPTLLLKP